MTAKLHRDPVDDLRDHEFDRQVAAIVDARSQSVSLSVRMQKALLDRLKEAADQRHMPYQTLMKRLLEAGLDALEKPRIPRGRRSHDAAPSRRHSGHRRPEARSAPSLDDIRRHRTEILRIARGHGASNVRVFGSVARGDAVGASDVDLLVDLAEPKPRGLAYVGIISDLQERLSQLLGRPVHVTEADRSDSATTERIRSEAVPL